MPGSLRWLALLVALSTLAAAVAVAVVYAQTSHKARLIAQASTGGSVAAGKVAIGRYGCGACHRIGGVTGAWGTVGPGLDGVAMRATIAGVLPNEPAAMVRWLRRPQAVVPGNGMPDQGVTARDARDMAAYLYTLRN